MGRERERSVVVKQSLKEGQNPSLRGLWEGRENGGSAFIWEAPGSVRGLIRVQYPLRVNGKGHGGWLEGKNDGGDGQFLKMRGVACCEECM